MNMITDLNATSAGDHVSAAGLRAVLANWPLPLQGPRVKLRALREQDLEAFRSYRADPEVARYQGWSTMDEKQAGAFIDAMRDVTGPRPGELIQLGIALMSNDHLIGDVGLRTCVEGRSAQIGYSCATQSQRRGLTSVAVRLLIDAIFSYTNCEHVHAIVDPCNIASERLLMRLGFERAADQAAMCDGVDCGEVTYQLPRGAKPSRPPEPTCPPVPPGAPDSGRLAPGCAPAHRRSA